MFQGKAAPPFNALELSAAIKAKKLSVKEAVEAYIDAIEKKDDQYNAFLAVSKEKALARAGEIQSQIDEAGAGEKLSPLAGVPIALNDNISTEGVETSCASKMLQGYAPVFNASVVGKLDKAGMIVIGKLNMDEFGLGAFPGRGVKGPVLNPWDTSRIAGGSSGGSAAAVAGGETPLAIGTDTGGGIRQPSAFCGVTGIKPTYGAVSRFGIIACASSLDQAGPVGMNIEDCAALLSIISGQDGKDSTCIIEKPFEFGGAGANNLNGAKIWLPVNFLYSFVSEEVKTAVLAAAKEFEAAGAIVEEFEMPLMDYVIPAYCVIRAAEVSSNLARFDGLKYGYRSEKARTLSEVYRLSRSEGFGPDVKRNVMLGSLALSSGYYDTYYRKALQTRTLIKDAYSTLLGRFDAILSPVAPATACKRDDSPDVSLDDSPSDPMKMYMNEIFTAPVNLAGLPAVSLPCGFDKLGLPLGFQIIGNAFSEPKLVHMARVYEARTNYHTKQPGGGA